MLDYIGFAVSVLAGIFTGMGLGGGTILMLYLVTFKNMDQRVAQGVILLFFIPSALISIFIQIKNKSLRLDKLSVIACGIFGAIIGSILAQIIDTHFLKIAFGMISVYFGLHYFFSKTKTKMQWLLH